MKHPQWRPTFHQLPYFQAPGTVTGEAGGLSGRRYTEAHGCVACVCVCLLVYVCAHISPHYYHAIFHRSTLQCLPLLHCRLQLSVGVILPCPFEGKRYLECMGALGGLFP